MGFRFVINKTPNKWRPVARSCRDTNSCVREDLFVFHPMSSQFLRDTSHYVQVNCMSRASNIANNLSEP